MLKTGDAFRLRSGGGGGYGSPLERPLADVQEDVRQGYVSVAAAAEFYGVVIDPETFEIDHAGTSHMRSQMRQVNTEITSQQTRPA
jgi:N-methylhydantoinase B